MINYVIGDLFENIPITDPTIKVIIPHICNDIGAWGKGFVVPLGRKFPDAKERYISWYKDTIPDRLAFQLGKTQSVIVGDVVVMNMIAQEGVRRQGYTTPIRYAKLVECMNYVAEACSYYQNKICFPNIEKVQIHAPKFGSGLAGGNWEFIEVLIKEIWKNVDVWIYELDPPKEKSVGFPDDLF